ncbi:MAG: phosphoribosylformylglycinamidine synthase I [Myxococcota bacterium]
MKPPVLILHATGTNRDREAAWACTLAGGEPEIVHVNQLVSGERRLMDYRFLVIPGGFSFGDDLGAGKMWALTLRHRLGDQLEAFVEAKRPVLGICNGFQVLVKSGLLPGGADGAVWSPRQDWTLTRNDSLRFECRWVYLKAKGDSSCIFTRDLDSVIHCPVAHGEGRFVARDAEALSRVDPAQVALRYVDPEGAVAGYPWNPNGSQGSIAGICNAEGTVMGLMPHPEDHVMPEQHPRYHRGERGLTGLPLFTNGVSYAAGL